MIKVNNRKGLEASLIPMVNLIFILLIFFLLVTEIKPKEFFVVNPPSSIQELIAGDIKIQLEVLGELVKEGKIRYIGLSNETPWGLMKFLSLAEQFDLPRVMSVQNPYSLLNRSYEVGLAEVSIREKCGLLAYSPLGFGMLSGKYDNGSKPDGARLTLFGDMFTRYTKPKGLMYSEKFNDLARESGLTPTQMSLAFVNSREFVTSNIIGATNLDQLKENINSTKINLTDDLLNKINSIHDENPFPCP